MLSAERAVQLARRAHSPEPFCTHLPDFQGRIPSRGSVKRTICKFWEDSQRLLGTQLNVAVTHGWQEKACKNGASCHSEAEELCPISCQQVRRTPSMLLAAIAEPASVDLL